jgi:hypothetical protein
MYLATLAAADTGRILCVVPSRWPPSRSLEAVAKAQSAGDVALLKCLDRANLTCTPAVDTHGDALISAMRSQRKPQMLRLLEATRAGRRHCEAGKPSEPCTKGCWGGGAWGFHGKPLKNHFLVTHFYRALQGKG